MILKPASNAAISNFFHKKYILFCITKSTVDSVLKWIPTNVKLEGLDWLKTVYFSFALLGKMLILGIYYIFQINPSIVQVTLKILSE